MEERRTKGMRIDVDDMEGSVDLISQIPSLKNIPSWKKYRGTLDRNKVCIYIIVLYSIDTYLNKIRVPLDERKKKALFHAGYKMDERGMFPSEVTQFLYELRSDAIFNMVHDYLRLQNDSTWTEIVISESELDEANAIRLQPIDPGDKKGMDTKKRLRETCQELNIYLDSLYKKFYNDHVDVKDRKRATTLEAIAKDLQEV